MESKSILSYEGPLSFRTIETLLSEFKVVAEEQGITFRVYKKMICVMIEALENVTRYNNRFPLNGHRVNDFSPSISVNRSTGFLELVTRNLVRTRDVESLRMKIDLVNSQDKDGLKELYKEILTNGTFTPEGGAGLGLIEIARNSGKKLKYSFENYPGRLTLYTFRVSLDL